MGPRARYLGPEVPAESSSGRTPSPPVDHELIDEKDVVALKGRILASGCGLAAGLDRVGVGVHLRGSDKRGGANGARIRLAPQKDWPVNQPAELAKVLKALEGIQTEFTRRPPAARRSRSPT